MNYHDSFASTLSYSENEITQFDAALEHTTNYT